MRAVFSSGVSTKQGFTRLLAVILIAFTTFAAPLCVAPLAVAEPIDIEIPETTSGEEPDEQNITLVNGTPTATSPSDMTAEAAKLRWTPTGTAETEDTYEVVVATRGPGDNSENLKDDIVMNQVGLTIAEQDLTSLGEGTYHWQVRSCLAVAACKEWSEVYTVRVDGSAPGLPTAALKSGEYDQMVTVGGLAETDAKIVARVGERTCETIADSTGAWSCAFAEDMKFGDYEATVTVYDKAGNASPPYEFTFSVNELFVAAPITVEELPPVLEVVPLSAVVENKVFKQPISVIDVVNMGEDISGPDESVLGAVSPLSTEGGVVQASESGWQVLGMPWYLWAGVGGMLSAGWAVYSGRSLRLSSFF